MVRGIRTAPFSSSRCFVDSEKFAKVTLYRVLLTPLGLHTWILGLVTGKIVSGRVSAGFKHSILLTIVSILGIWAVSNFNFGGGG